MLDVKTTFVGTMRFNKRELPSCFKTKRALHTSLFYEQKETGITLTLYQCKPDKSVAIISTENDRFLVPGEIQRNEKYCVANSTYSIRNEKSKPNTVLEYNSHKAGVDAVNQMTRTYNVKVPTRRWPMQVFFNILNLTIINSWILFKETLNSKISRRTFIIMLIEDILNIQTIGTTASTTPKCKRQIDDIEPRKTPKSLIYNDERQKCVIQVNCNRNSTNSVCSKCSCFVCSKCSGKKLEVVGVKCENENIIWTDSNLYLLIFLSHDWHCFIVIYSIYL